MVANHNINNSHLQIVGTGGIRSSSNPGKEYSVEPARRGGVRYVPANEKGRGGSGWRLGISRTIDWSPSFATFASHEGERSSFGRVYLFVLLDRIAVFENVLR